MVNEIPSHAAPDTIGIAQSAVEPSAPIANIKANIVLRELVMSSTREFRAYLSAIGRALPDSFRRHVWLILAILVYFAAGLVIGVSVGAPGAISINLYMSTYLNFMPRMIVALLALRAAYIILVLRPRRPLTLFLRELRTDLATPERIANAVPSLLLLPLFGGTYTLVKAAIPVLHPFSWDPTFERWDRWLHGGVAPWELLQPILGQPSVTFAINWGYSCWLVLVFFIWAWQTFSLRDPRLRMQFFYAVVGVWVLLGSIAAVILSSAGPCYFGRVTGLPDPFAPLMTYLGEADQSFSVWALTGQALLWHDYLNRAYALGAGISAMPSMHLSMTMIFMLLGWRTARWLGIGMTGVFILILVGSVHLGWHYAIDGYAGAIGTLGIWWAAGRLARMTVSIDATPLLAGTTNVAKA